MIRKELRSLLDTFLCQITGTDMMRRNAFYIYKVGFIGFSLLCEIYASGDSGLVSLAMEASLWGNGGHKRARLRNLEFSLPT